MPVPRIGEVDDLEVYLGQRGTGKSTAICARTRELCSQYGGAYVIGHSLGRRLPRTLPAELGGGTVPLVYHRDMKSLARGMRDKPDRWHILAPPLELEMPAGYYDTHTRETADDLLRYSVKLSTALRVRAWRKAHPMSLTRDVYKMDFDGLPSPPIIIIIDEGVAVEGAGAARTKEEHREFLEYVFSLRHLNIAILWSIQDPTARGWHILGQATWLHVFHIKHMYARNAVIAAGASPEEADQVEELYAYESINVRVSAEKRSEARARAERELGERIKTPAAKPGDDAPAKADVTPTV